jgi:hypothetical protein
VPTTTNKHRCRCCCFQVCQPSTIATVPGQVICLRWYCYCCHRGWQLLLLLLLLLLFFRTLCWCRGGKQHASVAGAVRSAVLMAITSTVFNIWLAGLAQTTTAM